MLESRRRQHKNRKQQTHRRQQRQRTRKTQNGGSADVQELGNILLLYSPVEEKREKALAFLTTHPTLNPNEEWLGAHNNYRMLLLVIAIREYMLDVAQKLIDMGADVNKKDSQYNHTVLMNSIGTSYSMMKIPPGYAPEDGIKFLLAHGAEPNLTDNYGNTALHIAAEQYAKIPIIEALIVGGSDVNIQNDRGSAPINGANLETTKLLISKGADVNTKAKDGMMPIHWPSSMANIPLATLLLENGANIEAPFGKYKKTPLLMALDRYEGDNRVDVNYVRLLLKYGANINAKDTKGRGVDDYINLIERGGADEDYDGEVDPDDKAFADKLRGVIKRARQFPERLGMAFAQKALNEATNIEYPWAPPGTYSIPIKKSIGKYLGHNNNNKN